MINKIKKAFMQNNRETVYSTLANKFSKYTCQNLVGITEDKFKKVIFSDLGKSDFNIEGYQNYEIDLQRDLSRKFFWGHNHDFGSFSLDGRMGFRHISVLADFLHMFDLSPDFFSGKHVFDIGCWTGGTTLTLTALGATVLSIEEVVKYSNTTRFLFESFGLSEQADVKALSIYDCNNKDFEEQFDLVYFPGVVYHLSDPVLALRILYNSLKIGGNIFIESEGLKSKEPICRFDGSRIIQSGSKKKLNRGGWNWFIPSASALERMMLEAGFDEVNVQLKKGTNRLFGMGVKKQKKGICKAGLSVRDIA